MIKMVKKFFDFIKTESPTVMNKFPVTYLAYFLNRFLTHPVWQTRDHLDENFQKNKRKNVPVLDTLVRIDLF